MRLTSAVVVLLQDAVVLALSFDMSLASATANKPEQEPALKRSLWLTIARHIVHQHPSQDQACLPCQPSNSPLKI